MDNEKDTLRVHIRWMIRRDVPEVLAIEGESFEFPWLEDDFIHCLRQRNCIGTVAEYDDRVVGFMVYELMKTRIEVLNFAVAADCRHHSVGRQMIAHLMGKLTRDRRRALMLNVRETNLPAQQFLRACGFRAVAILRKLFDNNEDAYRMQFCYTMASKEEDWCSTRANKPVAIN